MFVDIDPRTFNIDPVKIKKAITKPGYVVKETLVERTRTFWRDMRHYIFMAASGATLGLSTILGWIGLGPSYLPTFFSILSLAIGGYPVLKSAIKAALIPDLNVDTLVSIAAIAAASVGAYREAAAVIFIMLLGEFLEHLTVDKARKAALTPLPGWRLTRTSGNTINRQHRTFPLPSNERFSHRGRILTRDWRRYNGRADVVYQPKHMSPHALLEGYRYANRRFYSLSSIARRLSQSPVGLWWTLPLNLAYGMALTGRRAIGDPASVS